MPEILVAYALTKYMVFGISGLITDTNIPVPTPSIVLYGKPKVGFGEELQTTPLEVMVDPPSDIILPPEILIESLIEDIAIVLIEGLFTTGIAKQNFKQVSLFLNLKKSNFSNSAAVLSTK